MSMPIRPARTWLRPSGTSPMAGMPLASITRARITMVMRVGNARDDVAALAADEALDEAGRVAAAEDRPWQDRCRQTARAMRATSMTKATVSCTAQTFGGSVLRSRPMFRFARRPTPGATAANSLQPGLRRRTACSGRAGRSPSWSGAGPSPPAACSRAASGLADLGHPLGPPAEQGTQAAGLLSPPGTSMGLPHLGQGTRRPALASGAFSLLPQDEQ